ncbi:MAG: DUF5673 domain-containing protein [Solobacterium sp.]|jgi:hypothetical protein|nr:DUF5673 domain-containing protein [Solobacterium sp.]MCH4266669.1 DUF5673 domain-containing protein [Solobacterium sp.]
MDTTANWILTAIFGALGIWLLYEYVTTHKKVEIVDKRWTFSRILFVVAAALALFSAMLYNTMLDYLRLGCMMLCIVSFLLLHDGIGDEGLVAYGHFTPWTDVKGYDIQEKKNKVEVYFSGTERNTKKNDDFTIIVTFGLKQSEEVQAYLKKHIGKKYRRMKRD